MRILSKSFQQISTSPAIEIFMKMLLFSITSAVCSQIVFVSLRNRGRWYRIFINNRRCHRISILQRKSSCKQTRVARNIQYTRLYSRTMVNIRYKWRIIQFHLVIFINVCAFESPVCKRIQFNAKNYVYTKDLSRIHTDTYIPWSVVHREIFERYKFRTSRVGKCCF